MVAAQCLLGSISAVLSSPFLVLPQEKRLDAYPSTLSVTLFEKINLCVSDVTGSEIVRQISCLFGSKMHHAPMPTQKISN